MRNARRSLMPIHTMVGSRLQSQWTSHTEPSSGKIYMKAVRNKHETDNIWSKPTSPTLGQGCRGASRLRTPRGEARWIKMTVPL